MLKKLLLTSLSATLCFSSTQAAASADYIDQCNITWNSPSKNSSESMPVGGHDIGCNLWVENGDILFYMQRSGSFNEAGEYAKLGRVRLHLSPNPFEGKNISFSQELQLKDGSCKIEVQDPNSKEKLLDLNFWVDAYKPNVHVDMKTAQKSTVTATYENWRSADKEITEANRGRWSCFGLEGWPGKLIKKKDVIESTGQGVLFYHQNPATTYVTEVLLPQQGLDKLKSQMKDPIANRTFGGYMGGKGWQSLKGSTTGHYASTPYVGYSIESSKAAKAHQLIISTHISTDGNTEQWQKDVAQQHQEAQQQSAADKKASQAWWQQFWDRSYIAINPNSPNPKEIGWQIARNYQLFRYQLGCNTYGKYPTRFNGGNFTYDPEYTNSGYKHDPDWRAWGGDVFTSQNQRLVYWPMLKSGDFDAYMSQVHFYSLGLENAKKRVEHYFGHKGAMFCEYANEYGLEMGSSYGWEGNHRHRGKEVPFGDPSIDAVSRSGGEVEHGIPVNGSIAYHWESQVEHAYMLLDYHRFTGKSIEAYMPFIKNALIFFDEHYRARQKMRNGKEYGEDGKLVFYPSTACETYRGATNPTDLTQGIRACILAMLKLDDKHMSASDRQYFENYLSHLPALPMGEIDGKHVIKPADSYKVVNNIECPHYYPLFPFDLYACDDKLIPAFRNTWSLDKSFPKGMVQSWHQDGIFFARMRMIEEAKRYNSSKLKNADRRFPTFWGPGHDWTPDHNWGGSGMIGLQEMLMQTPGDRIILLPCWPEEWEVKFKLHAPKGTVVELEYVGGEVKYEVWPESRRKDVEVFLGRDQ